MQITVVINCYNSEKYISETASSLSSQTYSNFKVLFIDNHSTDQSFYRFKSNSNFNINYVKTPNFISLYSARNFSIQFIDTPLVCFLDADDLWNPNYLQNVNYFHEKNPTILAFQARTFSHRNGKNLIEITKKLENNNSIKVSDFAKISFPALGGISLKKDFFKNYNFPEPSNFIGDLDMVLNLAARRQLYFCKEAYFLYRIHPGGLTSSNLDGWEKELGNWLVTKKNHLPRELVSKLESEQKYISLRLMINKSNIFKFLKTLFSTDIPLLFKLKLIIRKLLNKK